MAPKRNPGWPRRILVTLGGADAVNATQAVCEAFADSALASRCRFTVLVGPQNPHRESLAASVAGLPGHWQIETGRHDLSALFQSSDLAITSASVTLYEMASVGLPFIALQTADNQRLVAESIPDSGAGLFASTWDRLPACRSETSIPSTLLQPSDKQVRREDIAPRSLLECFDLLIADDQLLHRMSAAGPRWIDGRGADRIVRRLMAGKLRVRPARPDDAVALWHLRNDPQVRANSLSQEPVSWSTHCTWFERLLENPDRRLFVLTDCRDAVAGQCRLDFEPCGASVTISIALAKELRGCSVGAGLVNHALAMLPADWQCNRLVAEVCHDNQPSRALFESLGFANVG